MDELTAKILADMEDQKAHPEDWRIIMECRDCGKTWEYPINKDEVVKYRKKYGTDILLTHCEYCKGG